MKKFKLSAIHEHDLDNLLSDLEVLQQLENKELKCHFCRGIVIRVGSNLSY